MDRILIDDEYLAFFQYVYAIHKKAERNAEFTSDRFFQIGNHPIQLHFVGKGLENILPHALTHIEIPPTDNPELTILLWDSKSSGTEISTLLSRYFEILGEWWQHLGIRGEIKELCNDRILTAYHLGPNIFSTIDLKFNLALYWVKDANELPYYEIGSPLRTILSWWSNQSNYQFVHAGAIGHSDGGVLLVGKGGSGKSTVSLACMEAGFSFVSDDYCLMKPGEKPHVYSVYNTAKLRGDTDFERFPNLAPLISNKSRLENEKALLFLHQHFPDKVVHGFPIKAILLPVITDHNETQLKPASGGATLKALAPTTLLQLPGANHSAINLMSDLIKQVPSYWLELGTDNTRIPEIIKDVLDHVQSA